MYIYTYNWTTTSTASKFIALDSLVRISNAILDVNPCFKSRVLKPFPHPTLPTHPTHPTHHPPPQPAYVHGHKGLLYAQCLHSSSIHHLNIHSLEQLTWWWWRRAPKKQGEGFVSRKMVFFLERKIPWKYENRPNSALQGTESVTTCWALVRFSFLRRHTRGFTTWRIIPI